MFTGLVQTMGCVRGIEPIGGDVRILIDTPVHPAFERVALGDSIAHAGVCLTVISIDGRCLGYDVSTETLSRTTLGRWQSGSKVNLEASLRVGDSLGGHLVSGHVDGVGQLLERHDDARALRMRFSVPAALAPLVAEKGSIAIDGVSLTINAVDRDSFWVALIPHTAEVTTLGGLVAGDPVNLEVDQIARYVARLREFSA
ncbi:MAG: riboflavin synthase [Ahniella sp.]|nr:riboflavin synthase [Ahniella sp.]